LIWHSELGLFRADKGINHYPHYPAYDQASETEDDSVCSHAPSENSHQLTGKRRN
jgi:hypothetical protein